MARATVPAEIEVKLEIPDAATLNAIARLPACGPYRLQPRDRVHLITTYFDTRDFALARAGIALRVRHDGARAEATVKWAGRVRGAVHERPELTIPLAGDGGPLRHPPPGPLYDELAAVLAGRPLQPILRTDIERRRIDVIAAGATAAELALDAVRLHHPQRRTLGRTYREAEIELRAGPRAAMHAVARQLRRAYRLQASAGTKFSRGVELLYGPNVPARIPTQPIAADDRIAVAVRKIVARYFSRLRQEDAGVRGGEDVETIHDMRVATRRLRATMREFRRVLPQAHYRRWLRELRWLADLLGGVRDRDVLLARLQQQAQAHGLAGVAELEARLAGERGERRAALLDALATRRYFRLLIAIERFVVSPAVDGEAPTIARCARRAVGRGVRKLLKLGDAYGRSPSDEELHALRIRVKRLRYLLESVRELTGDAGRNLVRRLVRLQDVLGAHHDAVVAAAALQRLAARTPELDIAPWLALQSDEAERARARFRRAWRRFERDVDDDVHRVRAALHRADRSREPS